MNDAPAVHTAQASTALLLLESIPEAKRLVASARDNDLAVWAHGQVEYTVGVTGQRNYLLHTGILPNDDLVLAVSMG